MSSTGLPGYFRFKSHRDEVNYWKDLALAYKNENQRLLQQITGCQSPARKRSASPAEDVTAQKRHKTSSMDPLDSEVLHEHVHRYIVQHLNGKDLLAMSEVSTSWNTFAESQKIGDKVRLKVDLKAMSAEDFRFVANSSRIYKEVSMDPQSEARSAAVMLMFADTTEKMKIDITYDDRDDELGDFSNLKSLDLTVNAGNDSWVFHSNMEQLEDLKLTVLGTCYGLKNLHNFVAKQKNLKRLDVSGCDSDFLQNFDDKPQFQLEHLEASLPLYEFFLRSQRESLQTFVCVSGCFKDEVSSFLAEFPKLIALETSFCSNRNWHNTDDGEELSTNTKIKKLKLQFMSDFNGGFQPFNLACREILLALPELELLDIEKVTIELMELIALNLHKLKELECSEMEDGAWERYEEMKREANGGISTGIELAINIEEDSE